MYAIVRIRNQQYRVEPELRLTVPALNGEVGTTINFDQVLLASDGQEIKVGNPVLDGCSVAAEVVRHGRAKKIVVFKKKRRKNYRRKKGHRQQFTEVRIKEIVGV